MVTIIYSYPRSGGSASPLNQTSYGGSTTLEQGVVFAFFFCAFLMLPTTKAEENKNLTNAEGLLMKTSYSKAGLIVSLDVFQKEAAIQGEGKDQALYFIIFGTLDIGSKGSITSFPFIVSQDDEGILLMCELQIQFDEHRRIYGGETSLSKKPMDAHERAEQVAILHEGLNVVFAGLLSSI